MKKVYYEYVLGPTKEIGQVIKQSYNTVTIQLHKSQLPPVTFNVNSDGTFTALGTKNKIKFILD